MKQQTQNIQATLAKFVSMATQKAVEATCDNEGVNVGSVQVLHTVMSAILPALMMMAMCVGRCPGERLCNKDSDNCCHNPPSRINQNSLFYCALVIAYAIQGKPEHLHKGDVRIPEAIKPDLETDEDISAVGMPVHLSGDVYYEAARAYEMLHGVRPDRFLDENLVNLLQNNEASMMLANEMLNKHLSQFKSSEH